MNEIGHFNKSIEIDKFDIDIDIQYSLIWMRLYCTH